MFQTRDFKKRFKDMLKNSNYGILSNNEPIKDYNLDKAIHKCDKCNKKVTNFFTVKTSKGTYNLCDDCFLKRGEFDAD